MMRALTAAGTFQLSAHAQTSLGTLQTDAARIDGSASTARAYPHLRDDVTKHPYSRSGLAGK
eukprot:6208795-Pleurochrysis_carterae.AAC.3